MNEATIGRFTWDGIEYEIDWPFELDDESTRSDYGVIYRDGEQVGEVCVKFGEAFETKDDVIDAAIEAIMAGEVDDA